MHPILKNWWIMICGFYFSETVFDRLLNFLLNNVDVDNLHLEIFFSLLEYVGLDVETVHGMNIKLAEK